jgi:hypothetical protein
MQNRAVRNREHPPPRLIMKSLPTSGSSLFFIACKDSRRLACSAPPCAPPTKYSSPKSRCRLGLALSAALSPATLGTECRPLVRFTYRPQSVHYGHHGGWLCSSCRCCPASLGRRGSVLATPAHFNYLKLQQGLSAKPGLHCVVAAGKPPVCKPPQRRGRGAPPQFQQTTTELRTEAGRRW